MTRFVLCDKQGNKISWLEATVRTFRIIGHPATIDEIYNVMVEEVVTEIPRTSKTPRQTIYGQIYTHSHDSKAGKGKCKQPLSAASRAAFPGQSGPY